MSNKKKKDRRNKKYKKKAILQVPSLFIETQDVPFDEVARLESSNRSHVLQLLMGTDDDTTYKALLKQFFMTKGLSIFFEDKEGILKQISDAIDHVLEIQLLRSKNLDFPQEKIAFIDSTLSLSREVISKSKQVDLLTATTLFEINQISLIKKAKEKLLDKLSEAEQNKEALCLCS